MLTFLRDCIARIEFWWIARDTFIYHDETGEGWAYTGYDIFRDVVNIRFSRFGYVTGESQFTRQFYQNALQEYKWSK